MYPHSVRKLFSATVLSSAILFAHSGFAEDRIPRFNPQAKTGFQFTAKYVLGVDVEFSGVFGEFPFTQEISPFEGSDIQRPYHDGAIFVDISGNEGGTTTDWRYQNSAQVPGDDTLRLHNYRTEGVEARPGDAEGKDFGLELQWYRRFIRTRPNTEFGLTAAVGFIPIKTSLTTGIDGTLVSVTDFFDLEGREPPEPPHDTRSLAPADRFVLISQPFDRRVDVLPGEANITGEYAISGAYYNFRFGPTLFFAHNHRWHVHLSAGAVMNYAGVNFDATERFQPPTGNEVVRTNSSSTDDWLPGFYADAAIQYWVSPRTAFNAGVGYQRSGDFDVTVGERRANVDLGTTLHLSTGISIQF